MSGTYRVGISLLIGVALVSSAYFLRDDVSAEGNNQAVVVAGDPLRFYQETADTDGDGIRDWEEELEGTDKYTVNEARTRATSTEKFQVKSKTDKFAVDFFSQYLLKKGEGGTITPQELQSVIAAGASEIEGLNTNTLLTRADVRVGADDSFAAIREYGNQAGAAIVIQGKTEKGSKGELELVNDALKTESREPLKQLPQIESGYNNIVEALKVIPVPPSLVEEHLVLLNSFLALRDNVSGMELLFDDPIVAFVRVRRYQDDANGLYEAIESLRKKFETGSIVYEKTEGGAFFFSLRP